jgi:methionyl-tRNA formyltransferase
MENALSILLFGQGHAGALALRELRACGHHILGCITHDRHERWEPSLIGECQRLAIPCWTDPAAIDGVISVPTRPDLVLSVGYRRRIDLPFLGLAKIGAFNVAGSQLPRYRGCFPFRWAILNGESSWGATVHQMTPRYCDGAVLHRLPIVVRPDENAYSFYERCDRTMATAAVEAVRKLAGGVYALTAVEPPSPLLFGPGVPHHGLIDWNQPAGRIDAFVRALDFGRATSDGYDHLTPPAVAAIKGRQIAIWRSRPGGTMSVYPPGTITRCDDQVWVQCARGHLAIEKIFAQGRDHDPAAYFRACGIRAGDEFDTTHSWAPPGRTHQHQPQVQEISHAA